MTELRHCTGRVVDLVQDSEVEGRVHITGHGEWRFRTACGGLKPGDGVRVLDTEGLVLVVEPALEDT